MMKKYAEVTDFLTDEIYYFEIKEARYMRKLDGKTHPYDIETAKDVIFRREKSMELKNSGTSGGTAVMACYVIGVVQLGMPLFWLLNILEVIVCFV